MVDLLAIDSTISWRDFRGAGHDVFEYYAIEAFHEAVLLRFAGGDVEKVNFGPAGSGSSLTGTIVFQRLGVEVEQVLIDQQAALQSCDLARSQL